MWHVPHSVDDVRVNLIGSRIKKVIRLLVMHPIVALVPRWAHGIVGLIELAIGAGNDAMDAGAVYQEALAPKRLPRANV